jgi:hypothetical protein
MRTTRIDSVNRWFEDLQHPTPLGSTAPLHADLDQLARECAIDKNDAPALTSRKCGSTGDKALSPNGLGGSSR